MTRHIVEVLPAAEQEFREVFLWYFERSPIAAEAFRSEVLETIDGLTDKADMWPANGDGFRFRVLDRFPYTVWHDLNGETATVVAIAHQHRRRITGRRAADFGLWPFSFLRVASTAVPGLKPAARSAA